MRIVSDEKHNCIRVYREKDENKLYAESTFYRHLADTLNKKIGTDFIPKRMYKDGHLVDDEQFYLTDRSRRFCFFQTDWAMTDICRDCFNKNKPVKLEFEYLYRLVLDEVKEEKKRIFDALKEERIIANLAPDVSDKKVKARGK